MKAVAERRLISGAKLRRNPHHCQLHHHFLKPTAIISGYMYFISNDSSDSKPMTMKRINDLPALSRINRILVMSNKLITVRVTRD